MPIIQTDMAEACGLTPVHVNRMLRALRADGVLKTGGRTVELLDLKRLWALAEFDPAYLFIDQSKLPHPR